jgi:hypothetical protein
MKRRIAALVPCLALVAIGLSSCTTNPGLMKDYTRNDTQLQKLQTNQPAPTITYSNDRAEIAQRLTTWNDPNKIGYVYLISYGKVMAFYTIKGMVASLNSYLAPMTGPLGTSPQDSVVDLPDLDGTYGSNSEGIFFYTTTGVYVEWKGEYMLCDQPLQLSTPPELLLNINPTTTP